MEYDKSYELFLAEKELFETLVKESVDLQYSDNIVMLESIQDTISKYLDKVTASIQKNWDRFKSKVGSEKQLDYLKKNAETITKGNPKFMINNFPNYDFGTLTAIKVIPFDYSTMKKQLKTKEDYIKANYPNLSSRDAVNTTAKTNMKKNIEKIIVKGYTDTLCDKKVLIQLYQFCLQSYQELVANIEEDLQIINNSNTTIMNTVGIFSTQESYNMILSEAPFINTNNNDNTNKKMTFTDADGSTEDPNDKTGKKSQRSYTKAVANYMKVSTDIISCKMALINDVYGDYMNVIKHYVNNKAASREAQQEENPNQKAEASKQVQI